MNSGIKMIFNIMNILAVCILLLSCTEVQPHEETFDILIHGGTIIDGTGAEGYRVDILISDNSIVHVGKVDLERIKVHRTIDAAGKFVTPGFIDAHAHGEPLSTPEFENFLRMGVTTITLGQDGSSPGVDDIAGWMDKVDEIKPGVNIAMFVGHGTVRRLAKVGYAIDVTMDDRERMAAIVGNAIEAGCFGLSTGLEYEPGSLSTMNELVAIAEPVGEYGGMVMSHLRSEDDDKIIEAVDELITQGMRAGCPVHISHIKITYGKDISRADEVLGLMERARENGLRVTADLYPYTASYTGIGIVFPDWARPPNDYNKVVETRRDELADFLRNRIELRNGPEATLFGTAPWSGMTLAEVAAELDKPFEDVLIDDIGPEGASAAYFVMDENVMRRFLVDSYVMICSDGSPTMRHPRGYGSFARIIRKYVDEEELLTLEEAIHKMTGLTATAIGYDAIENPRGYIKPGFAADIVIFDPANVKDHATYEEPYKFSEGFDFVIVNGVIAVKDDEFTGNRAGVVLRNNHK